MIKAIPLLICLTIFISCQNKKDNFNYDTSIASTVYEAQINYLDKTLANYSRISDTGAYYWKENILLENQSETFKGQIKKGLVISEKDQADFFNHFEKTFNNYALTDFDILSRLKKIPIKTISDVDILRVYIKNNFAAILLNPSC